MKSREVLIASIFSQLWALATASFRNGFKNIARGSDLLLQWNSTNATDYPLAIHSRLINQTSKYGANSLEVNITIGLNGTSFLWKSVPYPLPYLETAKYEVEIWPQSWAESNTAVPVFASSPYFVIFELGKDKNTDDSEDSFNGTMIIPSKPTDQPISKGGINNKTAIAAGLVVPVVVIFAVLGFVWMQQRQKMILEEKRKQREELYID